MQLDNHLKLNMDAFSYGQMSSKLWLCEELERLQKIFPRVWIYGSWYGSLAFLLLLRGKMQITQLRLFDLDGEALAVSRKLLQNWLNTDALSIDFVQQDCNHVELTTIFPNLVMNTSTEHIAEDLWWQKLPPQTWLAVQSTDMPDPEHIRPCQNLKELEQRFKSLSKIHYAGQKVFRTPDKTFSRFMIIGQV